MIYETNHENLIEKYHALIGSYLSQLTFIQYFMSSKKSQTAHL